MSCGAAKNLQIGFVTGVERPGSWLTGNREIISF
jgi:hypothetical protein